MPVGKPFLPGVLGNPEGRPKGALNLSAPIRSILEGDVSKLPKAIADTIRGAVGEDRPPLDAMVIVALLQALQGEKAWADWLSQNGYGKPVETHRLEGGDPDSPIKQEHTFRWQQPDESGGNR